MLIAGERIISDSTAILTYLADSHGRFTAPAGTLERAEQDAALHSALDEMDAVLWTAARHSFVLPKDKRLPAIKDSLKWEFGVTMGRLEAHLNDRTFVTGEAFSIADIVTAHCLRWAGNAGFPLPEGPLTTYRDRMYARPAAQRALARD